MVLVLITELAHRRCRQILGLGSVVLIRNGFACHLAGSLAALYALVRLPDAAVRQAISVLAVSSVPVLGIAAARSLSLVFRQKGVTQQGQASKGASSMAGRLVVELT